MSLSMYVKGFRPEDERWRSMKAVYDTCQVAGISVPVEVLNFFNYEAPDEKGVEIELGSQYGENHLCCTPYYSSGGDGFEIDISQVPEGVKTLRFYCSW